MTIAMLRNPTELIEPMLAELEASIASYPQDLCETYKRCAAELHWTKDVFGDEASEFEGMCERDLAKAHCLMFASAFAASVSGLPGREIEETPIASANILDVVTATGLPPREFLRHYGNLFTWKLLNLTGRISGDSNQPVPDLV